MSPPPPHHHETLLAPAVQLDAHAALKIADTADRGTCGVKVQQSRTIVGLALISSRSQLERRALTCLMKLI